MKATETGGNKNDVLKYLIEDASRSIRDIAKKMNSYRQKVWREKKRLEDEHIIWGYTAVVDANKIAREEIGRVITNTTMLGAMLAAAPIVPPERLEHALEERFGRIAAKNIAAFRRAQKETVITEAV